MPGAETGVAAGGDKALDDVDTMIQRLAERLEKNPADGEGFRMLGWSYVMTGHPDKAVEAYEQALPLLPKQANVHAGYGEALVGVAKGTVTQEAKDAFDKAIAADPTEPRARYFQALWLAQHGQEKQALDKWIALASSASADAPWQADLRRQIGETAAKLKVAVPAKLAAAPAAVHPGRRTGRTSTNRQQDRRSRQRAARRRSPGDGRSDGRGAGEEASGQPEGCRWLGAAAALAHGAQAGRAGGSRARHSPARAGRFGGGPGHGQWRGQGIRGSGKLMFSNTLLLLYLAPLLALWIGWSLYQAPSLAAVQSHHRGQPPGGAA